ncbi:zinc-ribbon domain-containing protein [Roseovarius sp. MBR-6]|jgi:predicted Zn finger-like uncharacterized protein|uniref:zinc-ribbon domain-containing protein n=1 Tax=Roseovarius sp. MBR-6 TaxID=3156459 RepID=UPI003395DDD6
MRLTCPNCGAQYEVPDAVIPVSGRDVQCSNCGNTWFQHHADHAPDDTETEPEPEAVEPEREPEPEPVPEDVPVSPPEAAPEPLPQPGPPPAAQRRIDPEIAEILREEAERERAARASEAGDRLETQPDLGLDAPASDERSQQARSRMERLRGGATRPEPPPEDTTPEEIDPPSRRNLFPDIDEINSSLSAHEDNGAVVRPPILPEEALPTPRKSGFRTGFRLAVITCVVALIVYLMAPTITAMAPGLERPVAQYVAAVDALRGLLSQAVAGIIGRG